MGKHGGGKDITNLSFLLGRVNLQGETPLRIAARAGHAGLVQALFDFVDGQNSDIESGRFSREMLGVKNVDDDTALHAAVRDGHLDVVKSLLEKDFTFPYRSNKAEVTPLYLAGEKGFGGIVSEVLKTCTSLLYGGPDGRTALLAAIIFGSQDPQTEHWSSYATFAITNAKKAMKLHNNECTTKLLSWRGILTKEADVHGWTPLHHAACLGHVQLVESLLNSDKPVAYLTTDENDGKNTALHIAASQGHVNVMKVLLSSCPDCWEIDNIKGQNILHIAVENKKDNVVEYIKKYSSLNSLINQKDYVGNISDPQLLLAVPTDAPNIETINTCKEPRRADVSTPRSQSSVSNVSESQDDSIEALRKMADTHMIVAALVATVTFTAGLTVPGGFVGNDGLNPGMAILIKHAAFKAFVITDTIALMCSVVAIIRYFNAARCKHKAQLEHTYEAANYYVTQAMMAMMIAFVTGTYAVLADSRALALSTCVLGSIFVGFAYSMLCDETSVLSILCCP